MNFDLFPLVNYNLDDLGNKLVLTDFTRAVKISESKLASSNFYATYRISDGERPDQISEILYGRSDWHWTIFLANPSLRNGMAMWPLSDEQFDKYITAKYDSFGVISFNPEPQEDPDSITLGDVPLNDTYLPWLYVYPAGDDSKRAKISHYDWTRCQLWIDNTLVGANDVDLFLDSPTFQLYIDPLAPSGVIADWDELGLGDKILTAAPREYTKALSKYAPYQYTALNTLENDVETLDAYTAIMLGEEAIATYITYRDAETVLNERKTMINVVDPSQIVKFVQSYGDIIRTV